MAKQKSDTLEALLSAEPGTLTATTAHVKLLAITELHSGIAAVANDAKFLKKD